MKNLITIFFLLCFVNAFTQIVADDRLIIQTAASIDEDFQFVDQQLQSSISSIKPLFKKNNIYLVRLESPTYFEMSLVALRRDRNIIHVSKDFKTSSRATPNDEFFSQQDGLEIINAPQFWDKSTGGTNVNGDDIVVAIIDDGYDAFHQDLTPNLWSNAGEIDNDNIDNDNNGFVDDITGVNISAATDDHAKLSHGTSVVGIIGAKGDNQIGVTGVNWNVKLMLLSTSGFVSDIIQAYAYAEDQRARYNDSNGAEGAFVVASNSSFGIDDAMAVDFPLWCGMFDALGNVGIVSAVSTSNSTKNVDLTGDMPSTCTSSYIIAVTSTNSADVIQGAFGPTSIDIAAPGDEMISTKLNNEYASFGGTSAAAPMVSGAIALLYSLNLDIFADNNNPASKALEVRNAIVNSSRPVGGLESSISSGGVLDLQRACVEISQDAVPVNVLAFEGISPNPVTDFLKLEFSVPLNESYEILVHNALGQLVFVDERSNNGLTGEEFILTVSDWASGYYAITIQTAEAKVAEDFIKIN